MTIFCIMTSCFYEGGRHVSLFTVGQLVHISLMPKSEVYYKTNIFEMDEKYFYASAPLNHEKHEYLRANIGQSYFFEYHSQDGALCRFDSVLMDYTQIPVPTWKFQIPETHKISREQRREFVRVPADIPVKVRWMNGNDKHSADVYSRDISGGGMAILIPKNVYFQLGQQVYIQFKLPNYHSEVMLAAEVTRVSERNDRGYASVSLQFLGLREGIRQKIIQYTFSRQRMIK